MADRPLGGDPRGFRTQVIFFINMDKEVVRLRILASGCVAAGFAAAGPVDEDVATRLDEWVARGENAGMEYMRRHALLKRDPGNVLPGVRTVISVAFSFNPPRRRDPYLPVIAAYAYGDDYHDVIRARLAPVVESLKNEAGGEWRICIDSAPLAERYWAVKGGIGYIGRNGMVIVDGYGSLVFLAEILSTLPFAPDAPSEKRCMECGACLKACPNHALSPEGTVDCRRCLSYLTIEHKGEWSDAMTEAMHAEAGRHTLFGCDQCLTVCPHNRSIPDTTVNEFHLRPSYSSLTKERSVMFSGEEFSSIFKGSAIKRAKLSGFLRNARNLS